MGREGRNHIEQHHTLDVFVESIRHIVEEVIDDFRAYLI